MGSHDMHAVWPALACFIVAATHSVAVVLTPRASPPNVKVTFDHCTFLPLCVHHPSPQGVKAQLAAIEATSAGQKETFVVDINLTQRLDSKRPRKEAVMPEVGVCRKAPSHYYTLAMTDTSYRRGNFGPGATGDGFNQCNQRSKITRSPSSSHERGLKPVS
ncbi:hypothetical protein OHC33_011285 [Knufia fluminis]|uniref:Uncharacterized protein n=1 Tax=Knufia fluminis TaxID=191047 RepID=A0AAN8E7D8_9EURO|nr:hypothetical protein OHC33_011285 [Knufia fluminis]